MTLKTPTNIEANQAGQKFIDGLGMFFESRGVSRIGGRMAGILFLSPQPMSLDDMVDRLGVSKGSVSTNARLMERLGLIERVSIQGDRRDYYQPADDIWERVLREGSEKIQAVINLARIGRKAVPPAHQHVTKRLEEMELFYSFFLAEFQRLLAQWENQHSEI